MKKIAFLGLGAMGLRMARRLIDAGYSVRLYNRTAARAVPLVEAGARLFETPKEAASGAEMVISMVSDDGAARAVWLDPEEGALQGLQSGAVVVESSTTTPDWIGTLDRAVADRGGRMLDAPVVGTRPQAESGSLVYLVGGQPEVVALAKPALMEMGQSLHHVGPGGHGARMKLVVNALFGIQVAALSEMLGFAERSGVSVASAVELLSEMAITSPALKGVGGLIAGRKFAPMFPIDLVEKDFSYAVDAASAQDADTPMTRAALEVYRAAQSAGHGADNIAGVAQLFIGTGTA